MVDKPNGISLSPGRDAAIAPEVNETILTLEMPKVEEIAKAIWQRQHATLAAEAISCSRQWRDPSIPSRFWNEFLLDAHAVLLLLRKKHNDYRNARESAVQQREIGAGETI